jgi:UDP-N-acetylglucosamine:LPS N-acetylglucosamine transferase
VAGGGFSLMSEAVYLGKPLLAVPLRGQFEQLMNGRYLARLGYGMCVERTTKAALAEFMERLPEFEHALARYEQVGNSVALRTIEEQAKEAAEAAPRELRRAKRTARRHTPRRRSATKGTP